MNKKMSNVSTVVGVVLLLSILFGISIANRPDPAQYEQGREESAKLTGTSIIENGTKRKIRNDGETLCNWLKGNINKDHFGGCYFEDVQSVFLITHDADQNVILEALQKQSNYPESIVLKQVKYSFAELKESFDKIPEYIETVGKGVDVQKNKVFVIISPIHYENYRTEILEYVNEDMVDWIVGELKVIDQYRTYAEG